MLHFVEVKRASFFLGDEGKARRETVDQAEKMRVVPIVLLFGCGKAAYKGSGGGCGHETTERVHLAYDHFKRSRSRRTSPGADFKGLFRREDTAYVT